MKKVPFRFVAFIVAVGLHGGACQGNETPRGADTVRIESVRPDKILYMYNEDATAEIRLVNQTGDSQTGTLAVTEEWDLTGSKPVWSGPVNLPPNTNVTVKVNWNVGNIMYGRGLRATFMQGTKAAAQGVEFYQVADPREWFRCFLGNGGGKNESQPVKAIPKSRYFMLNRTVDPFVTYGNYDIYLAAPSCFGDLAPAQAEWECSQAPDFVVKSELIEHIQKRQKQGVKAAAYTIGIAGGPVGYEMARQRPEWFTKDTNGVFKTCGTAVNPVELAGNNLGQRTVWPWYGLGVNFDNPDVVEFGGQNLVDSIRMFGWDSIFFDSIYRASDDARSEICVKKVREIIRASYPDVALWYNSGVRNLEPSFCLYNATVASLRDTNSGALMEMQGNELANPKNPWHQWRSLYETYLANRDDTENIEGLEDVVRCNGSLFNIWGSQSMSDGDLAASRDLWTAANHVGALQLAAHLHPYLSSSSGFRPVCQFMTRYSALLWARGIRRVKDPVGVIKVQSNRTVWWKECVYRRETNGVRDTLINIVNTADKATFDYKVARDPDPATRVEVEYVVQGDPKTVRVWALQPYGYDSRDKEPLAVELKPEIDGQTLIAELPAFAYYTLVVVREDRR